MEQATNQIQELTLDECDAVSGGIRIKFGWRSAIWAAAEWAAGLDWSSGFEGSDEYHAA